MGKKNYLISGYYGYKNSGDDALLASVVKDITDVNNKNSINILTKKGSNYDFKGVEFTDRFAFFKLIKAIKKTDILIMGGGSLLQDKTSNRSLYYYLFLMAMASFFKKKTFLYANGMGPISKSFNLWLSKKILDKMSIISLRDKDSLDFVKSIGVTKPEIILTADSVFSLEENLKPAEKVEKKVAFVIRDWEHSELFSKELAKFADHLIDSQQFEVVFLPLKLNDDEKIAENIISLMKNEAEMKVIESESEFIKYFSTCYFTVCMRLHGLIYSSMASSVPIGLSYDKKVTSICQSLGLDCMPMDEISLDKLIRISETLIDNHEKKRNDLIEHVNIQKEKAKINKEILKNL